MYYCLNKIQHLLWENDYNGRQWNIILKKVGESELFPNNE